MHTTPRPADVLQYGVGFQSSIAATGRQVAEGKRTTSDWRLPGSSFWKDSRKVVDSSGVLYIFQFAAIRCVRMYGSVFHDGGVVEGCEWVES